MKEGRKEGRDRKMGLSRKWKRRERNMNSSRAEPKRRKDR